VGVALVQAGSVLDRPADARALEVKRDVAPHLWDAFVQQHPDATVYHLSAWADVIEATCGHKTDRLAVMAGDRLAGILPVTSFRTPLFGRFAASVPFMNYGGVAAESEAAATKLRDAAVEIARENRAAYLELRHARRQFDGTPCQTHKVAMILPLRATVEQQWTALDRKLRNQVRKAEKSNLTVRVGGVELLDAFYDVMSENMRDLGSPLHGREFFERILTTFADRSRLLCVSLGDVPVAASFVLWHRDRLEVPWASALRRYNPLCPNILLYWEMLKFGIEKGFGSFDFGRSTPNEGTFLFKQQWGAEPLQLFWEYWLGEGASLPDRSPKNSKFQLAIQTWQRLPIGLTRVLGPRLVRNIP
jgi:FemAB-related protein (PEP-CTERM system-associated)